MCLHVNEQRYQQIYYFIYHIDVQANYAKWKKANKVK